MRNFGPAFGVYRAMKASRPFYLMAVALLFAFALCAAENAAVGTWDCTATSSDGNVLKTTLVVRQEAGGLAGDLTLESGEKLPLVDPKLTGNSFTFKVFIDNGPYPVDLKISGAKFTGKYAGPEASGTIEGVKKQ